MPVVHQILLMKRSPFQDHGRRTIRELPLEDNDGINSDLRLIPCIEGVEMRRIMLVEIHTNHDAKETKKRLTSGIRPYANTPFHIPIRPIQTLLGGLWAEECRGSEALKLSVPPLRVK